MLRKGELQFACSRWTIIGLDACGSLGAAFAVKVDMLNSGSSPLFLKDLLLVVETCDGKSIFYEPIFLFDMTRYIESIGEANRITMCQKGAIPLPTIVSAGERLNFGCEVLFLPHDKEKPVLIDSDSFFELKLLSLSGDSKNYRLIARQKITSSDIGNLSNGSFSGVMSTASTSKRDKYIETHAAQ